MEVQVQSPGIHTFEVTPHRYQPLVHDGLRVVELDPYRGRISSNSDVARALQEIEIGDIALIRRRALAPEFLNEVAQDAFDGHDPCDEDYGDRWNELGSLSPVNAIPHIHNMRNVFVAPQPDSCPTVFMDRSVTLSVLFDLEQATKLSFHLRMQLSVVLSQYNGTGDSDGLFVGLHYLEPEGAKSATELIAFTQMVQEKVAEQGGLLPVSLTEHDYGMVVIPKGALHARSVLDSPARDTRVAWRYYP